MYTVPLSQRSPWLISSHFLCRIISLSLHLLSLRLLFLMFFILQRCLFLFISLPLSHISFVSFAPLSSEGLLHCLSVCLSVFPFFLCFFVPYVLIFLSPLFLSCLFLLLYLCISVSIYLSLYPAINLSFSALTLLTLTISKFFLIFLFLLFYL